MIGHGRSFAIFGQLLSLVLLLLLLSLRGSGGGGVLGLKEESGQIMDGLLDQHRERLELLTTVLAMDKQWSAFRSEKIKKEFASGLVKDFCPTLPEFENDSFDSIEISKKIMMHCPYSGMHVQFAVRSVAISVECLFNRHAKLQLNVITDLPFNAIEQFAFHLKCLVGDYQLIANRLASINMPLHNLIALTRYFDEVRRQWVTYTKSDKNEKIYKDRIMRKAHQLIELLEKSEVYCAESPKVWYGQDDDDIELNMKEIEEMFIKTDNSTSTLPKDDILTEPILKKAHRLRLILLKEFEKLLLGKLPPEVWKQVFENHILVRQIESTKPKGVLGFLNLVKF